MTVTRKGRICCLLLLAGLVLFHTGCSTEVRAAARKTAKITLSSPANGATVTNSNTVLRKWWKNYKKHKAYKLSKKKARYGTSPITLKWKKVSKKKVTYVVSLSRDASFKKAKSYRVKNNYLKLRNLYCNTRYYWRVSRGRATSGTRWFRTGNMARILRVKGVKNVRDLGGYTTRDGKVVRQGMVYRSAKLDKIKKSGKRTLKKRLKLKTEIDLRADGEGSFGKDPKLAKEYMPLSGHAYYKMWDTERGRKGIVEKMRVFADRDNYPILFHCTYGRDRTGTLALVLNGLLGVGKKDLYRDYELTFFAMTPDKKYKGRMKKFDRTYRYLRTYKDKNKSLSYNIEAFLLDNGMTKKEINMIKEIMLISSS